MKIIEILLLCIVVTVSAKAQNSVPDLKGKISGKVIDGSTKSPVDYATVVIYKDGSATPSDGASTDPKGNFIIEHLAAGTYKITIDFLGYQQKIVDNVLISNSTSSASLGSIILMPVQNQLQSVSITAKAPVIENKIDKMVYNAANDITSQGGVALDVLKKVPQVTVDIDGNVELQGNSNIRFLINGKPSSIFGASLADALQSIPASQIKSIEVVTSPGAKYDAAGTGGIINIVLKDSKVQGINGNINLSGGTRVENGSFNLNARKGNFGASVFFSGNTQLNSRTLNTTNRTSYNGDTTSYLLQNGYNDFVRNGYQSGLNLNWSITPKDELTATFGYNHFDNHGSGLTNQQQENEDAANNLLSNVSSLRNSDSRFNSHNTDFSLNYKKTFKREKQELNILYTSTFGNNTYDYSQRQDYTNNSYPSSGTLSNNPGTDKETDISIDYTQPIIKELTIETGAKAVLENISNTVITDTLLANGSYLLDPNQSNGFKYNRSIYAYYLSATFSLFNDFITGKAGLRYEYTNATADFPGAYIPDYNIFAPSFVLSHKIDDKQSIKISYTYRVQRPNYSDLNPFYNISDPHNISTGNPSLKPEIGHNYELGYNKSFAKDDNIYIAAIYRYNTNDIQSYTYFYPTYTIDGTTYSNVFLSERANIGREVNTGANIYASIAVTPKLSLRSNIMLFERITYNPGSATINGFMYRLNLNGTYQFGHDIAAEVFGNYRSPQIGIQGHSPSFAFYNIAIRKQFLNKKISVGITATDIFNKYIDQTTTTYGTDFNQTYLRSVPFRSVGINLGYKFGKLEFKKDKEDNNAPEMPSEGK